MFDRLSARLRMECICSVLLWLVLASAASLKAAVIAGTVKDPSGAAVVDARVEVTGAGLAQGLVILSDAQGHFASSDLAPATYHIRVVHEGFEDLIKSVDLTLDSTALDLQLAIAQARQEITVSGRITRLANSDATYRQLRTVGIGTSWIVENVSFDDDVGTFLFRQGTLSFLAPVNGIVTGAVFTGGGHFTLKPTMTIDREELHRRTGADQFEEDFSEAVFRFSNGAHRKLLQVTGGKTSLDAGAGVVLRGWQDRMRHRREIARGFTESLLDGEAIDNVDADVLASIYNPSRPSFFNAYIRGAKHKDLRFFFRMRGGAIPAIDSPEEVALINYDPEGMEDGIWYQAHLKEEYLHGKANSQEERRFFSARKFNIETVISSNSRLTAVATVELEPLIPGERVVKFNLLPNLRVTRVSSGGKDLSYIQEDRKADGSFYVIFPEAAELATRYPVTVEYAGDKVISKAGAGSFYIGARECWYPNPNEFSERSLFELTFRVPKAYRLVSVGKLDKESIEDKFQVSHWITPSPITVAGFNFGDYKSTALADPHTGYNIEGYYLPTLPDNFARSQALQSMSPGAMTKRVLEQTRAQLQLCTYYFGSSGFDHIYITEQPNFDFGQSWPNLVYLPLSAYTDATQRWMLLGTIDRKLTSFVQEVTPHEVAHQWWGHAVGWASYHDQWLSEGFAEFSAALFVQMAQGSDWQQDYKEFWTRLQKEILEKNQWGASANDAGPLWLGLRLSSPKNETAYQALTYPKGAYVLNMLRSLMYSMQDGDKEFVNMMHDFVDSHRDHPASTESFKAIAEKHMTKSMDIARNGRLDWFFGEWVYGSRVPKYAFEYQLTPEAGGKAKLHMSLTQSEVDSTFVMAVPIYMDLGKPKGLVRIGQIPVAGNGTHTVDVELPVTPKGIQANPFKEILAR